MTDNNFTESIELFMITLALLSNECIKYGFDMQYIPIFVN